MHLLKFYSKYLRYDQNMLNLSLCARKERNRSVLSLTSFDVLIRKNPRRFNKRAHAHTNTKHITPRRALSHHTMEGESISDKRVRMINERQGEARLVASILTTVGAVEAVQTESVVSGLISVAVGLALEKQQRNPSTLLSWLAFAVAITPVAKLWSGRGYSTMTVTATQGFQLALKTSCALMALHLLFIGRRLRQLGEVQKSKSR